MNDPRTRLVAPTEFGLPDPFARSQACQIVAAANLPSPESGGPCATCAFRKGTEANASAHTTELAALCVEGLREFHCHEKPQLCRGFIAAANLRGVPQDEEDRHWMEVAGEAADILAMCIERAVEAQKGTTA
jgi:hypothetical protein